MFSSMRYIACAVLCLLFILASRASAGVVMPDLLIRSSTNTTFLGDDIYSITGAGQTAQAGVATGTSAIFVLRVQNDGASAGNIIVTGSTVNTGWSITYRDAMNRNITAEVAGSGWNSGLLAPGQFRTFTVQAIPDRMLAPGSQTVVQVMAASASNPYWRDVVRGVTTLLRPMQPDLWVRAATSDYMGDDVYNATGVGQTCAQTIARGTWATFLLRVQNDGMTAERFAVTGPTGGNGWTVRYFTTDTNTEITTQVTGKNGWQTSLLSPMQTEGLWAMVMPTDGMAGNTSRSLMIIAAAVNTPTRRDAVILTTTLAPCYQPDLWVRAGAETNYRGDNVYGTDGINQMTALNVHGGTSSTFFFRVQNDGNLPDTFTLHAPAGASPWTVTYYNLSAGADITTQITGSGWSTGTLAPGANTGIWVRISLAPSATAGTFNLPLVAASSHGSANDVTLSIVTCRP